MDVDRSFTERSEMTGRRRTRSFAYAVAQFTHHLLAVMLAALMARSAAPSVSARPVASTIPGRVELDVMPVCNGCKADRTKAHKVHRQLARLPAEVTSTKIFKRKTMAVHLCEFCDGDALASALDAHEKRTSRQ